MNIQNNEEAMNMLEKVAGILREYKDDDTLIVTESTTFEELGFDSLDTVELIMNIEEAFDVTLKTDEKLKTVADLIGTIEKAKQ